MNQGEWVEFWKAHGRSTRDRPEQEQVLRTSNRKPISQKQWRRTLAYVDTHFPVRETDDVLELCSGTGLFTEHFAPHCHSVTAVDISPDLIAVLDEKGLVNVETKVSDIRELSFPSGRFSRVLIYAGVQYLSEAETVRLFYKLAEWLCDGGILLLGDVPDRQRIWNFYNTPERVKQYFDNVVSGEDVVGTWFDPYWLEQLADSTGFARATSLSQPSEQIYAHFRFDFKAIR